MGFLGTKAGFYSDLSMVLEICTTIAFTIGVLYARKHKSIFHHRIMLSALALDIGFLVSYMVKSLIEGRTEFPKLTFPIAYKYVYLPIVIFHSIISIIVLALAV
ncbi:MAG: DUF420 domain-containing protein, partial [Euryarchaeota archaeon]|nr:DUF420 domain-containing protein [Euryarchaeota archaeon]